MAGNDYSVAAKILAIIAAVSFILTGILALYVWATWSSISGVAAVQAGAYGTYSQAAAGMVTTWILIGAILNLVAGSVVLIGGLKIGNPASRQTGSIMVLVAAIIGLFGGGGFILTGTILGIVAGILGLVSK
jgi:hypothetical protein